MTVFVAQHEKVRRKTIWFNEEHTGINEIFCSLNFYGNFCYRDFTGVRRCNEMIDLKELERGHVRE